MLRRRADTATPVPQVHCIAALEDEQSLARMMTDADGRSLPTGSVSLVNSDEGYFSNLCVVDNLLVGTVRWGMLAQVDPVSLERIEALGGGALDPRQLTRLTRTAICVARALSEDAPFLRVHRVVRQLADRSVDALMEMLHAKASGGADVAFSLDTFRPDAIYASDVVTIVRGGSIAYHGTATDLAPLRAQLLMVTRGAALERIVSEFARRTAGVSTVDGLLAEWIPALQAVVGTRSFAVRLDAPTLPPQVRTSTVGAQGNGLADELARWLSGYGGAGSEFLDLAGRRFRIEPIVVDAGEVGTFVVESEGDPLAVAVSDVIDIIGTAYNGFQLRRQSLRASRDLSRAEAVTTLVGGVAHDLNNRLQIIIGALDLIDRNRDREDVDAQLATVRIIAQDSRSFVSKLLAFSRVAHLAMQPLSLNALARDAAEIVRRGTSSVEVNVDPCPGDPIIEGDPVELRNVLVNLLLNSARAVPARGGRIDIQSRVNDDLTVSIAVIDNGHGIPAEFVDRIFQPFVSSGSSPMRTGLGLAVARSIVEEHGGHIQIRSTSPAGTTVVVTLPVSAMTLKPVESGSGAPGASGWDDPAPEESADASEAPHPTIRRRPRALPGMSSAPHVLLCDDDVDVLNVLEDMLTWAGCDVVAVTNPEEALERARDADRPFRLAIVDQVMEEMPGDELIDLLREIDPEIRIISLSGYRASEGETPKVNADMILMKPITIDQLTSAVDGLLDR